MAVKWAISGGFWSSPSIWNGGTLPATGDTVFANGQIVYINVNNLVMESLQNCENVTYGIVNGGTFYTAINGVFTGDIKGGGGTYCIYGTGALPFTIIGNVYAPATGGSYTIYNDLQAKLTIVGDVFAYDLFTSVIAIGYTVYHDQGSNLEITGNVYAGKSVGVICSRALSAFVLYGNIIGSSYNYGVLINNVTSVTIHGAAICNPSIGAVVPPLCSPYPDADVSIEAGECNENGGAAYAGYVKFNVPSPTYKVARKNTTRITLSDIGNISGALPAENDVRNGVVYALGDRTGSLNVPPKEAVSAGVPVDNTIGEATLNFNDWLIQLAASNNPIAVRLRNVSTPESVSSQLKAANS